MSEKTFEPTKGVNPFANAEPEDFSKPKEYNRLIYDMLRTVPKSALKSIEGGRLEGKKSIDPMWRIKRMTEVFGPVGIGWSFRIVDKQVFETDGYIVVETTVGARIRDERGNWSEESMGCGGAYLRKPERNGPFVDSDAGKKSLTDALGNALKFFGLGGDVYWSNDESRTTDLEAYRSGMRRSVKRQEDAATAPAADAAALSEDVARA